MFESTTDARTRDAIRTAHVERSAALAALIRRFLPVTDRCKQEP